MYRIYRSLLAYVVVTILATSHQVTGVTHKVSLAQYQDENTQLWGYRDPEGKIIIDPVYTHASTFNEFDVANVVFEANKKNCKYCKNSSKANEQRGDRCTHFLRINPKGKVLEETYFFDNGWDYYEEGLARFVKNNKIGFSNKACKVIIKAKYDFAIFFRDGLSVVSIGGEYYDHKKKPHPEGGCCHCIHESYEGGKWGAIDKKGKIVIPIKNNTAEEVIEKIKLLPKNGKSKDRR